MGHHRSFAPRPSLSHPLPPGLSLLRASSPPPFSPFRRNRIFPTADLEYFLSRSEVGRATATGVGGKERAGEGNPGGGVAETQPPPSGDAKVSTDRRIRKVSGESFSCERRPDAPSSTPKVPRPNVCGIGESREAFIISDDGSPPTTALVPLPLPPHPPVTPPFLSTSFISPHLAPLRLEQRII